VYIRIPGKQYDKCYAEAQRDRVSVAEWIRQRIAPTGPDRPDGDRK
jgi:hypothetical protein